MQREVLAADAAEAGVLEALLAATAAHKSAAAVGAGASCLTALCLAAPTLCSKLGQLQGQCRSACRCAYLSQTLLPEAPCQYARQAVHMEY